MPMPPADADFSFEIDFKKGIGRPRRVFDAASELIEAFEILDEALIQSVDNKMRPLLVLEDVEAGSIRVWLRNVLTRTEDDALKTLDWKPLIGRYLVKSKYLVLDFLNDENNANKPKLDILKDGLRRIAEETDIKHLPDYAPINEPKLLASMDQIQSAKRELVSGDKLTFEAEGRSLTVKLDSIWQPSENIEVGKEGIKETESEGEIILTIRKPDLLGSSMWLFGHGRSSVSANISDENWLFDFHSRKIPLYSGDALRCKAKFTFVYDENGTLLEQKFEILKVLEIIKGPGPQIELL